MSAVPARRGTAAVDGVEGDSHLILTPSKLRLHSHTFGLYVTSLWLPNSIFAALVLCKLCYAVALPWWMVFLPQWIGHGLHVMLVIAVVVNAGKLVEQQLGPVPPARASPGMMLQYSTMYSERKASLLVDNINGLIETIAGVAIKAVLCKALSSGSLSSPSFSWRMLLLPCWVAWFLTFAVSLFKPRRERTIGSMRDLLFICLLFVALKLDGVAAYTWSVVFLIPWMWFGALFLGAIITACVIVVAYACMDLRELALPGGFLLLLLSAGSQLPFFVYLCNYLDGAQAVTLQQIIIPQIASWTAMWLSGLLICYGLHKKEQLRARLAAAGQVWTAHEGAARELMSLELEDMQQQVDKMTNDELAQVAMRMMAGKAQPQQLLRVGTTLYRRAMSFTATSPKGPMNVIRRLDGDGTAQLADLAGAGAMEEGRPWPAVQHAAGAHHLEDAGDSVCVSVQVLPRPRPPADASQTTGIVAAVADASGSVGKQEQQKPDPDMLVVCVDEAALSAGQQSKVETAAAVSALLHTGDSDDGLCTICYDQQASCVFMECGHGGYCWRCAHVLFARPPSECPVCRQPIQQVVELEDPMCQVGRPARVKPAAAPSKSSGGGWFKGP